LTVDFAGVEGAECARKSAITGFLGFCCMLSISAGFLFFTQISWQPTGSYFCTVFAVCSFTEQLYKVGCQAGSLHRNEQNSFTKELRETVPLLFAVKNKKVAAP